MLMVSGNEKPQTKVQLRFTWLPMLAAPHLTSTVSITHCTQFTAR